MRCKNCHYSLAGRGGLTENRCPECGTPFDPNDPSTFEMRKPFWRMNRFVKQGLLIIVWLAAANGLVTYFQVLESRWLTLAILVMLAIALSVFVVTFLISCRAWLEEE